MSFISEVVEEKEAVNSDMLQKRRKLTIGLHSFFFSFKIRGQSLKISAVEDTNQDEFSSAIAPESVGMSAPNVTNFLEFVNAALFARPPDLRVTFGFVSPPRFGEEEGQGRRSKQTYEPGDSLLIQIKQTIRWQGAVTVNLILKWVEKSEISKLRDIIRIQQEQIQRLLSYIPVLLDDEATQFLVDTIRPRLNSRRWRKRPQGITLKSIYRAMFHGDDAYSFHGRCDNMGPTVTVVHDANGNIFGGYTQEPFQSRGSWVNDRNAFVFFVQWGGERISSVIKPRESKTDIIYDREGYLPRFGSDLILSGNSMQGQNSTHRFGYTFKNENGDPGSATSFLVRDYEVFQVVV